MVSGEGYGRGSTVRMRRSRLNGPDCLNVSRVLIGPVVCSSTLTDYIVSHWSKLTTYNYDVV